MANLVIIGIMSNKRECIIRLFRKNNSYSEMCEWLVESKIIEKDEPSAYIREHERASFILSTLQKAEEDGKLLLLYFEWEILPKELIRITCTSEKEEKVFSYGY